MKKNKTPDKPTIINQISNTKVVAMKKRGYSIDGRI